MNRRGFFASAAAAELALLGVKTAKASPSLYPCRQIHLSPVKPIDWRRVCHVLMASESGPQLRPWEIRTLTMPEIALYHQPVAFASGTTSEPN